MKEKKEKIQIFGAGPAGLSTAYWAVKKNINTTVYEAESTYGGNAKTLKYMDCKFDTGAHRFHDKIDFVTKEIKSLLGDSLNLVTAPSQIRLQEKNFIFPIQPIDVLNNLSIKNSGKIIWELIKKNIIKPDAINSFEDVAISSYGPTLSKLFLLNYSEKLWGEKCKYLSPTISGTRLKTMRLMPVLFDSLLRKKKFSKHMEGDFYYPKNGFGSIFDNMVKFIGEKNIILEKPITRIIWEKNKICSFEINTDQIVSATTICSTLPITRFISLLNPKPPILLLEKAKDIKYRNLRLAVLVIQKEKYSNFASIYFPDKTIPFTRVYEPKVRSSNLCPSEKTCLVLEVPCSKGDIFHSADSETFKNILMDDIGTILKIKENEIIGFTDYKIDNAYPILTNSSQNIVNELFNYLKKFKNLKMLGRNAEFQYSHLHSIMEESFNFVNDY